MNATFVVHLLVKGKKKSLPALRPETDCVSLYLSPAEDFWAFSAQKEGIAGFLLLRDGLLLEAFVLYMIFMRQMPPLGWGGEKYDSLSVDQQGLYEKRHAYSIFVCFSQNVGFFSVNRR